MKPKTFYARRETWKGEVVGTIRAKDIDMALFIARRMYGRGVYVSISNQKVVNFWYYTDRPEERFYWWDNEPSRS